RGEGIPRHLSAPAAASALHLFRGEPGGGQIADGCARPAGRRPATALDRARRARRGGRPENRRRARSRRALWLRAASGEAEEGGGLRSARTVRPSMLTCGIIGVGHLIRHVLPGMLKSDARFLLSERNRDTALDLAARFGLEIVVANQDIV